MKSMLYILLALFFAQCSSLAPENEPIHHRISSHIRTTCAPSGSCRIKLSDATQFEWETFYFFDQVAEDHEINKVLGLPFEKSSVYYSNKLVFVKDGKIVASEEHLIPEVDDPFGDGDVDFVTNSGGKFIKLSQTAPCDVERISTDPGELYRLHCSDSQ